MWAFIPTQLQLMRSVYHFAFCRHYLCVGSYPNITFVCLGPYILKVNNGSTSFHCLSNSKPFDSALCYSLLNLPKYCKVRQRRKYAISYTWNMMYDRGNQTRSLLRYWFCSLSLTNSSFLFWYKTRLKFFDNFKSYE